MLFYGERRHRVGQSHLEKGIEVDRATVQVIERLPPSISVNGKIFLGHVGFYRKFINDI